MKNSAAELDPDALKSRIRDFWNTEACGERYGDAQDRLRYQLEPEIVAFADFPSGRGLRLLEIGLGMGSDFIRFVEAGAFGTGVDITSRAVEITARRLRERGLDATLMVADAESCRSRMSHSTSCTRGAYSITRRIRNARFEKRGGRSRRAEP